MENKEKFNLKKWAETHQNEAISSAIALGAAIIMFIGTATGIFSFSEGTPEPQQPVEVVEQAPAPQVTVLDIGVMADSKVGEGSTPIIVHIVSIDDRETPLDFYHAIDPDKKKDQIVIDSGRYKITTFGIVNSDGSISFPEKDSKEFEITVQASDAPTRTYINFGEATSADKVAASDVEQISDLIKTAIENGDESLKGEQGRSILDRIEKNTQANNHLAPEVVQTVKKSTEVAKTATETTAKVTVVEVTPEIIQTWVPEKGHWEPQVNRVWVEDVVTVVDTPAYEKKIDDGSYWFCSDGTTLYTPSDVQAHISEQAAQGITVTARQVHNYIYEHVDAVTHTEDHSHWSDEVVGVSWVVDEEGHWE